LVFLFFPHKAAAPPKWTTFTTRDGLASNQVTSIFEDYQGNLWFWAKWSVTKYDGLSWTKFKLTSNFVISDTTIGVLLEDEQGNKWVRVQNEVTRYDSSTWRPFDLSWFFDSWGDRTVIDAKGNIWFIEGERLRSFHRGRWVDIPLPDEMLSTHDRLVERGIRDVLEDRNGNIWVGLYKEELKMGLYKYIPSKHKWILHKDMLVYDIFEDSQGNIWVGGRGGLFRYDGKRWSRFTTKDGLVSEAVNAILEDSRGNMWFGTDGGASRYSKGIWTTFTERDGLAKNFISAIYEDRTGNIWFGTYFGGVSRYNDVALESLPVNKLAGVRAILKDRDGNLWFGTAHGATMYDGRIWHTFTFSLGPYSHPGKPWYYYDELVSNAVFSIYEDNQGWLWLGTLSGTLYIISLADFEGILGKRVGYTYDFIRPDIRTITIFREYMWLSTGARVITQYGDRYPYITELFIWAIVRDGGEIWLGTQDGAMRLYGQGEFPYRKMTVSYLPPSAPSSVRDFSVRAILKDANGRLWFGTYGAGISVYQDGSWENFGAPDDGLVDNYVLTLMQDREGRVWAGTLRGVSIYEGFGWWDFEMPPQLRSYPVTAIFEDGRGNYWFGTEGGGVGRFDGSEWQVFTSEDGLAQDVVWSIAEDDRGNIWFGTPSGGVSRYDGREWTTFTEVSGYDVAPLDRIYDRVYSISEDRYGNLWFTTHGGGVVRYDGRNWTTFTTSNGLGDEWVNGVFVDSRGIIWACTRRGLFRSDDGLTFERFSPNDYFVNSVVEDGEGNLWFGTDRGAVRYDGRTRTTFLEKEKVRSIFLDSRGNLWFSTGGGIVRYDGTSFTSFPEVGAVDGIFEDGRGNIWVTHPWSSSDGVDRYDGTRWDRFTHEGTDGGLVDGHVHIIYPDGEGNVWFGTADGVSKLDSIGNWRNYKTSLGLKFNNLHAMLRDDRGIMWFGTDGGVVKFDGRRWITITSLDGLPDDRVYAVLQDRGGDIWLGTGGGPVRHRPDRGAPKVRIVAGPEDGSVVTDNDVLFVFEGGDLTCPKEDLLFTVWPDPNRPFPADPDPEDVEQWSPLSSATRASFKDLPDGEHAFRVMVVDRDLNRSSASRTFTVDTTPATAAITSPRNGSVVGGLVAISGVAFDPDGRFRDYEVQYRKYGKGSSDWELIRSSTVPMERDGQLALWDTRGLGGRYEVRLTVSDQFGRESAHRIEVTVDNVAPKAEIRKPAANSLVSGTVTVELEVADEHLDSFVLEYGRTPELERWDRVPSKGAVRGGFVEEEWNTYELEEGEYVLRLTVRDMAGNESVDAVRVKVVGAVDAQEGGLVEDLTGRVRVYIPPNALSQDVGVTIVRTPEDELRAALKEAGPEVTPTDVAYDLRGGGSKLAKPAILTVRYSDEEISSVGDEARLALFLWEGPSSWRRVGGTVDLDANEITTAITCFGRYALMEDLSEGTGRVSITDFTCQPRIFSPEGGGFSTHTAVTFKLGKDAEVSVRIFDRSGRLRRTLVDGRKMSRGVNVVYWDGRDDGGDTVESDLYVVAVVAGGTRAFGTVAVSNR